jgi:hypothetical protein
MSLDWMLECNYCRVRLQAWHEYRGTGNAGLAEVRELTALDGWTSDSETDRDICPSCTANGVLA